MATDSASQLLSSLTMADLMHINPRTLQVEPALATAVEHRTPTRWIVHLRRGVRFSDGAVFDAQDVAFSFQVYTDPKLDAPERQLLVVNGSPVRCQVLDAATVELDLPAPVAVGDRMLDSVWMLPRHRLLPAYKAGQFARVWGPDADPHLMAGLGAFRVAAYMPGQEVRLERNPNYWRSDGNGRTLPFLDQIHLPVVSDPNLRLTLFVRGQVDGVDTLTSNDFARLRTDPCCHLLNAGAGLNVEAMVLNQAPPTAGAEPATRSWFRQQSFRQAVSLALDRADLARHVYEGMASPLASLTSPSAGIWADPAPPTAADRAAAMKALQQAGFQMHGQKLEDAQDRPVTFSLIVPSSNAARMEIATFVQEDLRGVGMTVAVVPLDFSSYLDRLVHRNDFEAALIGIQIADADPNEESNLWPLDGAWHFWNQHSRAPLPWETQLDHLFRAQLAATDTVQRLRFYRGIQAIEHQQLPLIPLVAPDILAGAKPALQGAAAALLPPHLLWNADRLFWKPQS